MYIYYLAIATILFASFVIKVPKIKNKTVCIIAFVLLSTIEGLRSIDVGTDTRKYIELFLGYTQIKGLESCFLYLIYCIRLFTENGTIYLLIMSTITNGAIIFTIYRNTNNITISILSYILLYYYFNTYNISRQYLSISLYLAGYFLFVKKRYIYAIAIFILACSFHSLTTVGLLVYLSSFFEPHKITKQYVMNSVILGILFYLMLLFSERIIIDNMYDSKYFSLYSDTYLFDKYNGVRDIAINTIIFFTYISIVNKPKYYIISLFILTGSFLISIGEGFMRVLYTLDIFNIFIIDEIWSNSNRFKNQYIIKTAIIIFLLLYFSYLLFNNLMEVRDYQTWKTSRL